MTSLSAKISRNDDGSICVFLAGAIDEHSDFDGVFRDLDRDATFNLEGIDRINSMGIRNWIASISRFTKQYKARIEALSYPVVMQAHCVANLFASARVRSCMAPYYCPACKANQMVVVSVDEIPECPTEPPERRCSRCDALMEFDELDSYFRFLAGE
jgi:hypothetical protein